MATTSVFFVRCRSAVCWVTAALLTAAVEVDSRAAEPVPRDPRLIVVVVVDQMRGDYLRRFDGLFGDGGFRRLRHDGAFFSNAFVPYLPTETAPGHSTISTGCLPRQHGVVANKWFASPVEKKMAAAVEDSGTRLIDPRSKGRIGASPRALRGVTIGDQLKLASRQSRVYSIAVKDRSAILLAGKKPDGVFWCDKQTGRFVSSNYYCDALPNYIEEVNAAGGLFQYAGKRWEPVLPAVAYSSFRPASKEWSTFLARFGVGFPHVVSPLPDQPDEAYSEEVLSTPFSNELIFSVARKIIESTNLGNGTMPDLLFVGLSANDHIGHVFGPDSPELADATVQTDRQLASFLEYLDRRIGLDHCLMVLTADHGITSSAHLTMQLGLGGGFIDESQLGSELDRTLAREAGSVSSGGRLVREINLPWVYCTPAFDEADRQSGGRLTKVGINFLRSVPGVDRVFSAGELASSPCDGDPDQVLAWNSYFAGRSGQFLLRLAPYWQAKDAEDVGEHACGSRSDRHVPIVFSGPRIRVGEFAQPAELTDVAVTIAALLGIEAPPNASGRVLVEALEDGRATNLKPVPGG